MGCAESSQKRNIRRKGEVSRGSQKQQLRDISYSDQTDISSGALCCVHMMSLFISSLLSFCIRLLQSDKVGLST